jgi:hypothetical protein
MILLHGKDFDLFSIIIDLANLFLLNRNVWRGNPIVSRGDLLMILLSGESSSPFFLSGKIWKILKEGLYTKKSKLK